MAYFTKKIVKHKEIFLLSLLFLFLRFLFLTRLPIFNDESIYLNWGWKEVHTYGQLYYSLFDGKQPLLMWVFGFMQDLISDPLVAGRVVSVLSGFFSFLGIYILSKNIFEKKTAFFAAFLYMVIPLFSFYDRQALMESSIAAIGIWWCYVLHAMFTKPTKKQGIFLGFLFGIGYFIKGTALLFLVTTFFIVMIFWITKRLKKHKPIVVNIFIACIVGSTILLPLFQQRLFWEGLPLSNRYILSFSQVSRFPFVVWFTNVKDAIEISFWFVTPFIFITSILGIAAAYKNVKNSYAIILWLIVNLFFMILITKSVSARYIIPFLPLLCVFAGYFLALLQKKGKWLFYGIFSMIFFTAFIITAIQIVSPLTYFSLLDKVTKFSQKEEYVTSWTSGYGINDIKKQIDSIAKKQKIILGIRPDSGNPEDALFVYYNGSKQVEPIYINNVIMRYWIKQIFCRKPNIRLYYVSRGTQMAGLEKYVEKELSIIKKPQGKEYLGLYKLKTTCIAIESKK